MQVPANPTRAAFPSRCRQVVDCKTAQDWAARLRDGLE